MRKLIEKTEGSLVVCDNPKCDYTIPYSTENNELIKWINVPCPKCGENLLTVDDYLVHEKLIKMVDWINKWFSWLTLFHRKTKIQSVKVHFHDGIFTTKIKH